MFGKSKWLISLVLSFITIFSSIVPASAQVPDEVKKGAEVSIGSFQPVISNEKEHYGLNASDKVDQVSLGEGYPFYKISADALKEMNTGVQVSSLSKLTIPSEKYIFPLYVGNKEVGVALADKENGVWKVYQISSYLTFDSDITEAKQVIVQKYGELGSIGNNKVKLIYDEYSGLKGLSVTTTSGEYIVAIHDNQSLALKKSNSAPVSIYANKLLALYRHRNQLSAIDAGGGVMGYPNKNSHFPLISVLAILSIILIISLWFYGRRKKKYLK